MTSSPLQSGSTTLSEGKIEVNGVTYAKHPQHWYEDGNFCFLVENTAYRLHRSLLARRSSVMADLFTLPQRIPDPDPDDLFKTPTHIDGIPVVKLHDKAEDFSNVLNIIYADITSGCEQSHLDAQALMGVVYLSHKYFFSKIKDWGVSRLSSQFLLVVKDEELRSTLRSDLYSDPKSCVQIIRFAQTCHLPQFLPLAFYALATIDWGEKSAVDFAAVDELSREDRWRAQEGKSTLTKALVSQAFIMPENGGIKALCTAIGCRRGNPSRVLWNYPAKRWLELQLHPIEELEYRLSRSYTFLCNSCKADVRSRTKVLRDSLVSCLAEFFRLP